MKDEKEDPTEVNVRFVGKWWKKSEMARIMRLLTNVGIISAYHDMAVSIGVPGIRITIMRKPDDYAWDQVRIPADSQRIREGDGYLVNTALTLILTEIGGVMAEVRILTDEEYERPTDADKVSENVWARGPE